MTSSRAQPLRRSRPASPDTSTGAGRGGRDDTSDLRPVRWAGWRRHGLPRAALVAALLVLAAVILYTPEANGSHPSPGDDTLATTSTPLATTSASRRTTEGPPAPPDGLVGVPISLAEPAALAVITPGARVDLLATPPDAGRRKPVLVAAQALVLDVVTAAETGDGLGAVYLALRPDQARDAIGWPEHTRFSIIVR